MQARKWFFTARFRNVCANAQLPTSRPQAFVDKLWIYFPVGDPQRPQNEQWRGFQRGAFGYNEGPTSSCQTFCWKARQSFDVPFFYPRHGALRAFTAPTP